MSIIIEGMDNSGKTTLAKKLALEFDLPVVTRYCPPREPAELLKQVLTFLVLNPRVIFDRYPLFSEAVYGIILRDTDIFEPPMTWMMYVDRLFLDKPFIIYCQPPIDVILEFKGEQMEGVVKHAKELITAYDNLIQRLRDIGFRVFNYDYMVPNAYKTIRNTLIDYLMSRSQ